MAKVYKNVDEFIRLTFPKAYEERRYRPDASLESYAWEAKKYLEERNNNMAKSEKKENFT
jgi:hypothetical protein